MIDSIYRVAVLFLIAAFCLLIGCQSGDVVVDIPVKASQVGGNIDSSMTWTLELSPYQVVSPIVIFQGAVLTIDPGVEINFNWKMGFAVLGSLVANGTPDSLIHFSTVDGVWNGFAFAGGSADTLSSLTYCIIEYCNFGVVCDSLSSPIIEHCTIQNFTNVGIYVGYYAAPEIVDNDILNLVPGGDPTGIQCDPFAFPTIYGNRLRGHSRGVLCRYISFTIIDSTYIAECDTGVYCYYTYNTVTIRHSEIDSNQVGVGLFWSSPEITDNTITGNNKGIQGGLLSAPFVRRNDFSANTWTYYNLTPNGVDAEQNWWGTTDSTTIASGIYDYYDSTAYGIVDFIPTLAIPPTIVEGN
jgi:hypothetical protein